MKKLLYIHYILLSMLFVSAVTGCKGADLWDAMPAEISAFIDLYYPNSEIDAYTKSDKGYSVRLDDGPGFAFDSERNWTSIDGYGMPLKEILIYDLTPAPLYRYLETIDATAGVFVLARDAREYRLKLLEDSLAYDIASEQVRTML